MYLLEWLWKHDLWLLLSHVGRELRTGSSRALWNTITETWFQVWKKRVNIEIEASLLFINGSDPSVTVIYESQFFIPCLLLLFFLLFLLFVVLVLFVLLLLCFDPPHPSPSPPPPLSSSPPLLQCLRLNKSHLKSMATLSSVSPNYKITFVLTALLKVRRRQSRP